MMETGASRPISVILTDLLARAGDRISLGEIAEEMGGRASGLALLVFALPETIPMIGLSLILAVPIAMIGGYMVAHGEEVSLPGWLRRRSIRRTLVEAAVDRMLPVVRWVEQRSQPRWTRLARACRLQGAVSLAMAIVLAVPMPGVNILAAFSVFGTGLGMLLRDGRIVAIAFVFAALAATGLAGVLLGIMALAS
jgi:hypothetical protein